MDVMGYLGEMVRKETKVIKKIKEIVVHKDHLDLKMVVLSTHDGVESLVLITQEHSCFTKE